MSDLERDEIYIEIGEQLDMIDQIIEDNDIDVEGDEQFAEIDDFIKRLRAIINGE